MCTILTTQEMTQAGIAQADFGIETLCLSGLLASRQQHNNEVRMRLIGLAVAMILGFLVAPSALAPIVVEAQPSDRVYRIGVLARTSPTVNAANLDSFRQGLRALGYVEGKNLVIEYRSAEGRDDRFAELAAELVRLKVDLILTRGTPAALAAKNATPVIPVVITGVGDPVGQGIITSLARPGGNITGLSAIVTDVYPKRVELLKELDPKAARIAALFNMSNPAIPRQWAAVETTARALGLQAHLLDVPKVDDLRPAVEAGLRDRPAALGVRRAGPRPPGTPARRSQGGRSTAGVRDGRPRSRRGAGRRPRDPDARERVAHRRPCGQAPAAGGVRVDRVRGRARELRRQLPRPLSARPPLHRKDLQGRQARRSAGR